MSIEDEVKRFITFMEEHESDELRYDGKSGLLITKGCEGDFGGCCSKQYDLSGLVDELKELIG